MVLNLVTCMSNKNHVSKISDMFLFLDDDTQSIEEKELQEKLARLNAHVAKANAELAEALRLSAETENTAAEAQLAAERAKQEAKNIEEEIEFRAKVSAIDLFNGFRYVLYSCNRR